MFWDYWSRSSGKMTYSCEADSKEEVIEIIERVVKGE